MSIKSKITHLPYRVFKARGSGLIIEKHANNLDTSLLGVGEYEPLYTSKIIKTQSIKDQKNHNTCGWNASIICKEVDEECILKVSSVVSYARQNNLLNGNGYSKFSDNQRVLVNFGAEEGQEIVDSLWESYSNKHLNYIEADKHKAKTYWAVYNKSDIYKFLDQDKPLETGIEWFTGFNQGGGFKAPWIIKEKIGWSVGGHAFALIGYIRDYQGEDVFVFQNSYGKNWGDNGKFYITVDYFMKNNLGFYVSLDIPKNVAEFIVKYTNKKVKGRDKNIYLIKDGKKRLFSDWGAYLAFNGKTDPFIQLVADDLMALDNIELGEKIKITDSELYKNIVSLDDDKKSLLSTLKTIK